jgi:phage/plasmid-like protein (TIGR03299 family)
MHELDMDAAGNARMFAVVRDMARDTPWHKLGTMKATAPRNAAEAIVSAGANWKVFKMPVGLLGDSVAIPGAFATVRETPDRGMETLGMVGAKYTVMQNEAAFEWFDPVVADGRASFETAGVLRGGRVVWVLAKLASGFEVVPGDRVNGYLLLSNTHDGSRAIEARFTPIRVVCANTLREAHKGNVGDRPIKIRHTASLTDRLAEAQRVMGAASQAMESTAEAFRAMARVSMSGAKLQAFIRDVLEQPAEGKLSTRTQNTVNAIAELYDGAGLGLDMPGVRGTAWAAYNAVAEFVDYKRGSDDGDDRLASMAFGTGAEMKDRALRAALAMA